MNVPVPCPKRCYLTFLGFGNDRNNFLKQERYSIERKPLLSLSRAIGYRRCLWKDLLSIDLCQGIDSGLTSSVLWADMNNLGKDQFSWFAFIREFRFQKTK